MRSSVMDYVSVSVSKQFLVSCSAIREIFVNKTETK